MDEDLHIVATEIITSRRTSEQNPNSSPTCIHVPQSVDVPRLNADFELSSLKVDTSNTYTFPVSKSCKGPLGPMPAQSQIFSTHRPH